MDSETSKKWTVKLLKMESETSKMDSETIKTWTMKLTNNGQ